MTNEMLLIIITSKRRDLMTAIEQAEVLMPEGASREPQPRFLWNADGGFTAFQPFYDLLESLDNDIAILSGEKVSQ